MAENQNDWIESIDGDDEAYDASDIETDIDGSGDTEDGEYSDDDSSFDFGNSDQVPSYAAEGNYGSGMVDGVAYYFDGTGFHPATDPAMHISFDFIQEIEELLEAEKAARHFSEDFNDADEATEAPHSVECDMTGLVHA